MSFTEWNNSGRMVRRVYPYDLSKDVESIYLSFRMEDEVVVTEHGAESITGPGEALIEIEC